MRNLLLAAAATLAIASPAAARDNSAYVGIEGGVLFPKSTKINGSVDFTDPLIPDLLSTRLGSVKYKKGWDIDAIAGYDFGMFRLEGELGYKRATNKSLNISQSFVTALNTGSGGTFIASDFNLNGHTSVTSAMLNGLVDFGGPDSVNFSVGAGIGRARVKSLGDSDNAWAYQLLAEARYPISAAVDIGLKYRYFRTGKLNFNDDFSFVGVAPASGGTVFFDNNSKFASHSLLASLIFNFGGVEAAPPPPPPMAEPMAPPPPPPATQTCPDGSVILATDACPPPPPPPPPAAPVERGERGQ